MVLFELITRFTSYNGLLPLSYTLISDQSRFNTPPMTLFAAFFVSEKNKENIVKTSYIEPLRFSVQTFAPVPLF